METEAAAETETEVAAETETEVAAETAVMANNENNEQWQKQRKR
jgi:hypothetical protein